MTVTITENVEYTQTGWRPGEEATLTNRPYVSHDFDAWNAHPDKRGLNAALQQLQDGLLRGYEDALTAEQKAERSREAERQMMADAAAFYKNRAPGDNRSFWD